MKLTLDSLLVLNTINRVGTFAKAATELHRVRSAVTYTVNKLEQDLGITIFDRSGYHVKLTPEGEILLREGNRVLMQASQIESMFKRMKSGWEESISIAVDDTITIEKFLPFLKLFYEACPTMRLKISAEILSGTWFALTNGRADIAIGVSGDVPASSQFAIKPIGVMNFVFAVSPEHPLAKLQEPLPNEEIIKYRSVVVMDTGNLDRYSGTLTGQETLTVTSMKAKINAQITGLGVGYLPLHLIKQAIQAGQLIPKEVEKGKPSAHFSMAWHVDKVGKGMQWFLDHIKENFWT